MSLTLFLGGIFLFIFVLGIILEKVRIPWIFAALILGLGLAFNNPFSQITDSQTFKFLAQLGMYFLLFLIGFELNFSKIRKIGKFIIKAGFFIIFLEAILGGLLIHYVFHYPWFVSALIALSFATVGEAVLIPILDEFKLIKTKLGQTILGIGTFDDVIEVLVVILVVVSLPFLAGGVGKELGLDLGQIPIILLSLVALFIFSIGLIKLKPKISRIKFLKVEAVFPLILSIFFLFLGIGISAEIALATLGALLAGIVVKNFLPREKIGAVEDQIKTVTYGLFGPIFFLWVGIDTDINYLITFPILILLVIVVAKSAKILGSYLIGRKELGTKPSIIMGIALGVRFSTSIVIIKLLFENGVMEKGLYSVLIGSTIAFKFIIPLLLSYLIPKWKIAPGKLSKPY